MENIEPVRVWTDGACIGNPGPGGWAFRKTYGGQTIDRSGGVRGVTTNNQMELLAAIQGSRSLKRLDLPAIIYTDSQYVVMGMNEHLPNWLKRGWRKSDGKPVMNRELFETLSALRDSRAPGAELSFEWVRGHAGDPQNEAVDRLAEEAAREAERAVGLGTTMPTIFDSASGLVVPAFAVVR